MNKKKRLAVPERISTGIRGFDELAGGLPAGRVSLLLGGPGSGKTLFGLQMLVHQARLGHAGVFVSFNETPRQLVADGAGLGWDLEALEKEKLVFLDARIRPGVAKAGRFCLLDLLCGVRAVASEVGARFLVFDALDAQLALLAGPAAELSELFLLRDWLMENAFTGLITACPGNGEPAALSRRTLLEFVSDCTLSLEIDVEGEQCNRHLRLLKCRGSAILDAALPVVIRESGLEVTGPARPPAAPAPATRSGQIHPEIALARKQLSARVQALDRFLEMKQAELDFLMQKQAPAQETRRKGLSDPRAARRRAESALPGGSSQ
jgi:KaiC/GvpD/RAD55 family RecA-like ATPase